MATPTNIPAEVRVALPEVCDTIIEVLELIDRRDYSEFLADAVEELREALHHINTADEHIAAHNAKVFADAHDAEHRDSSWFDEGNWDGACWRDARDGDQIRLRDPQARDNGGPVYVIDGVPAYRADGTLSVRAFLLPAPRQTWNWPEGNCQLEFSEACWQVWRDFA